jgi:gliding motility associated protien GldN
MMKELIQAALVPAVMFISILTADAQNTSSPAGSQAQQFAGDPDAYVAGNDPYALPWNTIQEKNILWKKRVWRTIDTRKTGNDVFSGTLGQHRATPLATLLINGVLTGACKAYNPEDDRFTKVFTREELMASINLPLQGKASDFNAEQVTKYLIKEDWLFLEKENKMVVRMVGIAPVKETTNPDGTITFQPLFWLYYPNCRSYLAAQPLVVNNVPAVQNWDQLFISRNFSSTIDKVSNQRTHKQ